MKRNLIRSLPEAHEFIKQMDDQLIKGWDMDYRHRANKAVKDIIEEEMSNRIDHYLAEMAIRGEADRRNGTYNRHLLTEIGDIELQVPRTRTYSAVEVVRAYARRPRHIDQTIMACFVLGLSTRKVAKALFPVLGENISASTVSRVAKSLDHAVKSFHKRCIMRRYRFLLFDGVVLKRRTGGGARKRVVLVALGITRDGKKEVIDFRIALGESQAAWEAFLNDLYRRGLTGEGLELVATDGGKGLLAALPLIFPQLPIQRCWAHKARNILNHFRKADHNQGKTDLHQISHAKHVRAARKAIGHFRNTWKEIYPKAVSSLIADEEQLLNFFQIKDPEIWSTIRTTNAIERRFVEVRRRTRPMGVFSDRTSMERILFSVFTHENMSQGVGAPFLIVTQNS